MAFFLLFSIKIGLWVQQFAGFRDVFNKNVTNNLQDSFLVVNFACNNNIKNRYIDDNN
jgi:hypothetical protein